MSSKLKDVAKSQLFHHPYRDRVIDLMRKGKKDCEVERFLKSKDTPVNIQAIARFRKALLQADPRTYVEQKLGEIRASFKAVDKHLAAIKMLESKMQIYQKFSEECHKENDIKGMTDWDWKLEKLLYVYNRMVCDHIKAQGIIRNMAVGKEDSEDTFNKAREKMFKRLKNIKPSTES